MRTIILHHIEEEWRRGLLDFNNVHLDEYIERVAKHLNHAKYDRIILSTFSGEGLEECHWPLHKFKIETYEYGYGWEYDDFDNDPDNFAPGGMHSNFVRIDDWMRTLKRDKVTIAGCFDGCCLEDLEIALSSLGIKFRRWEKLIV